MRQSRIRRRNEPKPIHYVRWEDMIARCYRPDSNGYEHYGGRGIEVCSEWQGTDGYLNYASYIERLLGAQPSPNHTIDRIDNDGDYEPGNIRWADRPQQAANTRPKLNKSSGHKGVSWSKAVGKWHVYVKTNGKRLNIGHFADLDEAIKAQEHHEQVYREYPE